MRVYSESIVSGEPYEAELSLTQLLLNVADHNPVTIHHLSRQDVGPIDGQHRQLITIVYEIHRKEESDV